MTSTANPARTILNELIQTGKEGETIYGIFNDPEFFEPKFQRGEIHSSMREVFLETPLWTTPSASAAKRYMIWTNGERSSQGTLQTYGEAVLRTRDLTPWRDIKGTELDAIDDGRRANG